MSVDLTKKQQGCITFSSAQNPQHLLVRGVAGSGKTTVLVERAKYLAKQNPNSKLLLVTFNKAIATYIQRLADNCIQARTFHSWGYELIRSHGWINRRLIDDNERKEKIRFAYNTVKKYEGGLELPTITENNPVPAIVRFLGEEFSWMKGRSIISKDAYMKVERRGRGRTIQVTKDMRDTIWRIFQKYQSIMQQYELMDFNDVALILQRFSDRISPNHQIDHILIDEAQDLTLAQVNFLRIMARRSLTIAADTGQKIYATSFSWRDAGVEITGGRTKVLLNSFRSTKEIISLAKSLQEKDANLANQEGFIPADLPNATGPKPVLFKVSDENEELTLIIDLVTELRSTVPQQTIGIIARSLPRLDTFAEYLKSKKIAYSYVKADDNNHDVDLFSPGVKLSTFHSSKGLEFDHVIITGLKKGYMPFNESFLRGTGDDIEDILTRERLLLYVAITRAKYTLSLIAVHPYSPFISEFGREFYIVKTF